MKNTIIYYYNLNINDIHQIKDYYYFIYNEEKYYLVPYNRPLEDIKALQTLNVECLQRGLLVHEIILNKDKSIITYNNNIAYILMKVYVNERAKITIRDIHDIAFKTRGIKIESVLSRFDYFKLWSSKIDYFEYQVSQMGKDFRIIRESMGYYIGMAENAISYIKNATLELKPTPIDVATVAHKRININDTLFDVYNPLNFIIDYKERDVSEYIKMNFFADKKYLIAEIKEYLKYNIESNYGARILFGRLLYPTYYFDVYEKIMRGELEEEALLKIIKKNSEYEEFLCDFQEYLTSLVPIPPVDWLNKK